MPGTDDVALYLNELQFTWKRFTGLIAYNVYLVGQRKHLVKLTPKFNNFVCFFNCSFQVFIESLLKVKIHTEMFLKCCFS